MVLFWGVVLVAMVFAVAAVVVGREARRLDAVPPNPVFDIDDAVAWVADRLPYEVSAILSHGEVRQIIDLNLEYFRTRGVSGNGHTTEVEGPVVVGGAETVDYVLRRAGAVGAEFTAGQVHAVLEAQMGYLEAIGAAGPEAAEDP
ncbi:MAG: hypothetical protein H0W70_04295 [Actinobacteria bacterium]|nr:hypothetical protein [Actinomycetota bacterium]